MADYLLFILINFCHTKLNEKKTWVSYNFGYRRLSVSSSETAKTTDIHYIRRFSKGFETDKLQGGSKYEYIRCFLSTGKSGLSEYPTGKN
jgi:hypothetical protein